MNFLRDINKLSISNTVKSFFTKWKIEGKDLTTSVDVLFPIGCVGISSKAKNWISNFQALNYSILVSNASDIIKKYLLKDGDYFYGKDENYILIQDDDIVLKTKSLTINAESININVTNNIIINGITISFTDNKVSIAGKEIAVIGGTINPSNNTINTSGQ